MLEPLNLIAQRDKHNDRLVEHLVLRSHQVECIGLLKRRQLEHMGWLVDSGYQLTRIRSRQKSRDNVHHVDHTHPTPSTREHTHTHTHTRTHTHTVMVRIVMQEHSRQSRLDRG